MSKPRIMGASLAGSTTVDVNVNCNQGGGNKKNKDCLVLPICVALLFSP